MFHEGALCSRPSFLAPGSFRLKTCVLQHEELCFWSVCGHFSAPALSAAPGNWMLKFAGAALRVPGSSFPQGSAVRSVVRTWTLCLSLHCRLFLLLESCLNAASCIFTEVTYSDTLWSLQAAMRHVICENESFAASFPIWMPFPSCCWARPGLRRQAVDAKCDGRLLSSGGRAFSLSAERGGGWGL